MTARELYKQSEQFIGYAKSTIYKAIVHDKKNYFIRKTYMIDSKMRQESQNDAKMRARAVKINSKVKTIGCYEDETRRMLYTLFETFNGNLETDSRVGNLRSLLRSQSPKRYLTYKSLFKILSELHKEKIYLKTFEMSSFAVIDGKDEEDSLRLLDFRSAVDGKEMSEEELVEVDPQTQKKYNRFEVDDVKQACSAISFLEYGTDDVLSVPDMDEKDKALINDMFDDKGVNQLKAKIIASQKLNYLPKDPQKSIHGFLTSCLAQQPSKVPSAEKLASNLDKLCQNSGAKKKGLFNFF